MRIREFPQHTRRIRFDRRIQRDDDRGRAGQRLELVDEIGHRNRALPAGIVGGQVVPRRPCAPVARQQRDVRVQDDTVGLVPDRRQQAMFAVRGVGKQRVGPYRCGTPSRRHRTPRRRAVGCRSQRRGACALSAAPACRRARRAIAPRFFPHRRARHLAPCAIADGRRSAAAHGWRRSGRTWATETRGCRAVARTRLRPPSAAGTSHGMALNSSPRRGTRRA